MRNVIALLFLSLSLSTACLADQQPFAQALPDSRQMLLCCPTETENVYKFILVTFKANGEPDTIISAAKAELKDNAWQIPSGHKTIFEEQAPKIAGIEMISDLTLPAESKGTTALAMKGFKKAHEYYLHDEAMHRLLLNKEDRNFSYFRLDEQRQRLEYHFARSVKIAEKTETSEQPQLVMDDLVICMWAHDAEFPNFYHAKSSTSTLPIK